MPENKTSDPPSERACAAERCVRLLLLHADADALHRAERLCTRLAPASARQISLEAMSWGFELLSSATIRAAACDRAAESDVIIFSVAADDRIHDGVRTLCRQLTPDSGELRRAIVLLHPPARSRLQARWPGWRFLKRVSDDLDAEFFCLAADEDAEAPGTIPDELQNRYFNPPLPKEEATRQRQGNT